MAIEYKKYIKLFSAIICLFFAFRTAFAATLTLTKIGALDLGGKTYSEWWYTGTKPTFVGSAANNATVAIKIGENSSTVTANASGIWTYYAAIDKGDYKITVTSGTETLSFTLHLGQTMPDNAVSQTSVSATGTPSTGFNQFVGITFGFGIILLATYLYFSTDSKKKSIFENRMLKED